VIPLGKSLDVTWQSSFVVPTYMIESGSATGSAPTPELRTVQDLRNYTDVFATPDSDGKAVLWNCPPIWNCSKINEGQVRAYGLDDVIELRDPGSEEALFAEVLQATEERRAWLGFMWSPTKAASTLNLTRLIEPTCDVGQNPEDGCGYDASRVRIAVHPSLVAEAADLVELFRRWDFKESTQFVAEGCLQETPGEFEKAATCYLNKEQAVWAQWVTIDAAKRVREALRTD
jgi:glycine betaine/proline transport system substrate-binding protein